MLLTAQCSPAPAASGDSLLSISILLYSIALGIETWYLLWESCLHRLFKRPQGQTPDHRERALDSPLVAHLRQLFEGSLHFPSDTGYRPLSCVILTYSMACPLSLLLEIPTAWITYKWKNWRMWRTFLTSGPSGQESSGRWRREQAPADTSERMPWCWVHRARTDPLNDWWGCKILRVAATAS